VNEVLLLSVMAKIQLGLEKDILQITAHATRLGPYSLCERFAWCQQIYIVLNVDMEGIPGGIDSAADRILEEESGDWIRKILCEYWRTSKVRE